MIAFIFAGIVLCCAFTNAIIEYAVSNYFISYLSAISDIGLFMTTIVATIYAMMQYNEHKNAQRTNLLCEYNQRYSTDTNIKRVIEWILKVAITNEKGEVINVDIDKSYYKPGINTREMFMRFFEELQLQIDKGNLNANDVYNFFAYYAIIYDQFEDLHKDITDYTRWEVVKSTKYGQEDKIINDNWDLFSKFVAKMNEINKIKEEK